jgi:murein DD-endopeptidase MepM/ murein hydrolase activator NlpD
VLAAGLVTLVLLATTPANTGVSHGSAAATLVSSRSSAQAAFMRASGAGAPRAAVPAAGGQGCPMSDRPSSYVNPLAHAAVTAKRIDQGVDYAGSGMLTAIGAARISFIATANTGWPGEFIDYQLLDGPDAGCYVFYAEGLTPAAGLHVGQIVRAGQPVAVLVPTASSGIEIGWASGRGAISYAAKAGQWSSAHESDDIPSAAGLYFSALIASLGGPPGKVEG